MSPVFFTDRDLGKSFARRLNQVHPTVEEHSQHFDQDCPDDVWLAEIGQRGWVAVTHDGRIRYKPNEQQAVLENGVALLVVVGKGKYPELAEHFVRTLPRILAFIGSHQPPYIAKVHTPTPKEIEKNPDAMGRVEMWFPQPADSKD